jgi:hypothetical protein
VKRQIQGDPAKITQLPRGTLEKLSLGSSFAEYDRMLMKPGVFLETPAFKAAADSTSQKCFFVGRRGTGKTAITFFLRERLQNRTLLLLPQIFSSLAEYFDVSSFSDLKQRHFKTLVVSFKRALQAEVIRDWLARGIFSFNNAPPEILRERTLIEDVDFDASLVQLVAKLFDLIKTKDERQWLREVNRTKEISAAMDALRESAKWDRTIVIDRIDEAWDGSDGSVVLLAALMHACVELTAASDCMRPKLFLRENMFERVRNIDTEFARLETSVISLEWSHELLLEMIERRLNVVLTAKFSLRGPTWDAFFATVSGESSQHFVFDYCHSRPRDVLTYCSLAVEAAQSKRHHHVEIEDLLAARRRFSENRLKDLGDEYSENYPQLQLILNRFFGLGKEYTINGIAAFIKKLLVDEEVKASCRPWLFKYTTPDRFIHLMYDIGFFGLKDGESVAYRSSGPQTAAPPSLKTSSIIVIHPSYVDALNLQNVVIGDLEEIELKSSGIVVDLPGAIDLTEYQETLTALMENLRTLPSGLEHAGKFEVIVGEIVRLCFFKTLSNVQPHVRDFEGRVVRDWIASNHTNGGFWEMVRLRYNATQVIWECKNFTDLDAPVFHQAAYYMNEGIGRFVVLAFRGDELKKHHYEHIRRISTQQDGLLLPLTERDLLVFMRQAIKGKERDLHLQEIYDKTVRMIS